jgi:LEA14-like dessication related protein
MKRKDAPPARMRAGSCLVRMLAILAIAAFAGCASVAPRNPPRIDVVAVELERVDGPQVFFGLTLQLTNDGDDDIVISAMQGALAIEGENIAQAALASAPVRVPAHGTSRAQLSAQTGMDAMLRAIAAAMRRGATLVAPGARPTLRYSITGSATLGSGYRLPFSRAGEIG